MAIVKVIMMVTYFVLLFNQTNLKHFSIHATIHTFQKVQRTEAVARVHFFLLHRLVKVVEILICNMDSIIHYSYIK